MLEAPMDAEHAHAGQPMYDLDGCVGSAVAAQPFAERLSADSLISASAGNSERTIDLSKVCTTAMTSGKVLMDPSQQVLAPRRSALLDVLCSSQSAVGDAGLSIIAPPCRIDSTLVGCGFPGEVAVPMQLEEHMSRADSQIGVVHLAMQPANASFILQWSHTVAAVVDPGLQVRGLLLFRHIWSCACPCYLWSQLPACFANL